MLRAIYANITYVLYQPMGSLNAHISDVLSHKLYDDSTSLAYTTISISRPVRRVPLPVLQRLHNMEDAILDMKSAVELAAVKNLVRENRAERNAIQGLVNEVQDGKDRIYVVGGVGGAKMADVNADAGRLPLARADYVFLPSGRRGERNRQLVSIKRNSRRDARPTADKVAEMADTLEAAGVVVSHAHLRAAGFGSDTIRAFLRDRRHQRDDGDSDDDVGGGGGIGPANIISKRHMRALETSARRARWLRRQQHKGGNV
jgi:hypothetical protein